MANVRRISRKYYVRQIVSCSLVWCMLFVIPARVAMAEVVLTSNPTGMITVTPLGGGTIQDMTASNGAIGNFSDFDILAGHIVTCVQPDATSQALFRVSGNGTEIFGTFNANGGIWLIDPAGILVGSGGSVNVTNFVASSLDIADADFINGIYKFNDGGIAGDVTNEGNIIAGRMAALIGKNVINRGLISASGGTVILAAGESVLLSDVGSNVIVEVTMPKTDPGCYDYDVVHEGDGSIDAQKVILAAGDVWSMAYISAYSEPGSNAVATVDIDAKGNVQITDDIEAEAYGNGVDDAIAAVTITAGGSVELTGNALDDTEVKATAHDGLNNTATVDISADGDFTQNDAVVVKAEADFGDVLNQAEVSITGRNVTIETLSEGWIDCWFSADALIGAYAQNAEENRAVVNITATGDEECPGNVLLQAGGIRDCALVEASAKDGSENYADVVIDATGDVSVIAEKADAQIIAQANDNEDEPAVINEAGIDITAGGNVKVIAEWGHRASIEATAVNALNSNTANINVTAEDGYVLVNGIGGKYSFWDGFIQSHASIEATAEYAGESEESTNSANITIVAKDVVEEVLEEVAIEGEEDFANDGDVLVKGENGGKAEIEAIAMSGADNSAGVDITSDGDVKVLAECWNQPSQAEITALAKYGITNTSDIGIVAFGDVKVIAKDGGDAEIESIAKYADNTNTATIAIDAVGGDVKVIDIGESYDTAKIAATATDALLSNNADVTISATATTSEYEYEGEVYLEVEGGDVKVIAKEGGNAEITALAENAGDIEGFDSENSSNTANVTINATAAEGTRPKPVSDGDMLYMLIEPAGYEAEDYTDGGDVKVIAEGGSDAEIEAIAKNGGTNTADVLICIDGGLKVEGEFGGEAEIEAIAKEGYSNTASVGIGAKGDDGVQVIADFGGEAGISSKAKDGSINTASTIVCTQGGVDVIALRGGDAEILAQAIGEFIADAYVGVCAVDDVIVQAGQQYEIGCDALIRAEAEIEGYEPVYFALQLPDIPYVPMEPTTANAETVVISKEGSVEVLGFNRGNAEISSGAYNAYHNDAYTGVCAEENVIVQAYDGEAMIISEAEGYWLFRPTDTIEDDGPILPTTANAETVAIAQKGYVLVADISAEEPRTAGIVSEASYAELNTAYTGVAAGTELASAPVREVEEPVIDSISLDDGIIIPGLGEPLPGGVYVVALGPYSDATIDSFTNGGYENIADTVVCVPGEVVVYKEGYHSTARIKSIAENGPVTKATTQVYAREVLVDVGGLYHGSGIGAWTDSEGWVHVEDGFRFVTGDSEFPPLLAQSEENGDSTLIIDSYVNRKDCPDCPVCPDCPCEEGAPLMPPAPIHIEELGEGGCPALMNWLANEIGVPGENIQVFVANAMAGSPGIQPCDMCAKLVSASATMQDSAGTRIAALTQVLNEFVTTPAPPSEEQMTSIAAAFAEHVDDDTHYASAGQWIDALVGYVNILNTEMGFSTADSVAFAQKYLTPVTDAGNAALTAYVQARLAAIGG
jgi:filamentous hemagglutinin family protein